MRTALLATLLMAGACTHAPAATHPFVDAATAAPGLVVDMRYATSENFVGRPIDGYEAPVCLLTRPAADALARVQARLAPFGFGLKVFDCYRPARSVAHFVRWANDPADQRRKADHYPNVDKARLFELGYIAERSGHSRGSTVDVSLVDLASAEPLDMGSRYDLFDPKSAPDDTRFDAGVRANRLLLQSVMAGAGFRPLAEEWWHFTLNDEPFPDTCFDTVVKAQ